MAGQAMGRGTGIGMPLDVWMKAHLRARSSAVSGVDRWLWKVLSRRAISRWSELRSAASSIAWWDVVGLGWDMVGLGGM